MFERTYLIRRALLITLAIIMGQIMAGCEQVVTTDSCIDCHMDKDTLIEVADPIETIEDSGEG